MWELTASVTRSDAATKTLHSCLSYGRNQQRVAAERVVPLHQSLGVAIGMKVVTNFRFCMLSRKGSQLREKLFCCMHVEHPRLWPGCSLSYFERMGGGVGSEQGQRTR